MRGYGGLLVQIAAQLAKSVHGYSHSSPLSLPPGKVNIRLGMCIDSMVAGVVGLNKPRYHVFGDAVNRAEQLQSHSLHFHVYVGEEILHTFGLNSQLVNLIDDLPPLV